MKRSESSFHYCKKHKQKYAKYLHRCPVCLGEEIAPDPETLRIDNVIDELDNNDIVAYTIKTGVERKKSVDKSGSAVIKRKPKSKPTKQRRKS